jgi:hypothetical protein
MDVLSRFIKEMNTGASIGSVGGVASYETPLTIKKHVKGYGRGGGSDDIETRLMRLKRRYKNCVDEDRKKKIKKQIKKYEKILNENTMKIVLLYKPLMLLENVDAIQKKVEKEKVEKTKPHDKEDIKKDRDKSRDIWEKIKDEIQEEYDKSMEIIKRLCIMDEDKKKEIICNIRLKTHAIEKISKFANECGKCDYHYNSCFRKINTIIKNLKNDIESGMEKLKSQ